MSDALIHGEQHNANTKGTISNGNHNKTTSNVWSVSPMDTSDEIDDDRVYLKTQRNNRKDKHCDSSAVA